MRTTPRFRDALLALVLLGTAASAVAAVADDEEEDSEQSDARWSLALATQVDQESNRGVDGMVGYELYPNTEIRVGASSVDYTATNPKGFHSNGIELGASHEFEHWSLDGAVRHWQDTDILGATELKVGADVHLGKFSLGPRGEYRKSTFDKQKLNRTITLRDGTQLPVAATTSCKLGNSGFGLRGAFEGEIWGAYASAMSYQYQNAKCTFDVTGLDALRRPDLKILQQLTAPLVARLGAVATRRIGREDTLLDSELDAGVSWKHGDLVVSLDYTRQKELFSGAQSNTGSVTGTADLGDNTGVDVTLGMTQGGNVKSGGFIGFAVRARF